MENIFEVQKVVIKYLRQENLSEAESAILERLLATEGGRELIEKFEDKEWVSAQLQRMQEQNDQIVWEKIQSGSAMDGARLAGMVDSIVVPMPRKGLRGIWRAGVAAAVIVVVAGAAYWGLMRGPTEAIKPPVTATVAREVLPGGDRAVLTLGDGTQINLDSSAFGRVADQGNVKISKQANGQLVYSVLNEKPNAPAFNTLSTPRAGQFSILLPDGTKVWLNNASSLRYPTNFTGASREVTLNGEGFFDVAKNPAMPFKVSVKNSGVGEDGGIVKVLGTSFNVMAYPDEGSERITLLQGSIQVEGQGHKQTLKPAEQSVIGSDGSVQTMRNVNVQEVTAWTKGYFHFDHTSLEGTMRQLARWYDVEVVYKGNPADQAFTGTGKIQRNLPLAVVLKALETEHIHFQLEGRKLIVTP
jgi:transmembrane sensor